MNDAADLLARLWRAGAQCPELPEASRPADLDAAYALQAAFVTATGHAAIGWKLGVGSPLAMRDAGLGRPLVGRVLDARCFRSGAAVVVTGGAPITLEFEIAFVLAHDVAPTQTIVDPRSVIASACTTFELVRSRFVDRHAVGWPSFAADNVGFEALVIGDAIELAQIDAITRDVVVECNAAVAARGLIGDALTDPFASLAALLAHARERGITLKRGEIVSTGAAARPFDFDGDAEIVARFPGGALRTRVARRELLQQPVAPRR